MTQHGQQPLVGSIPAYAGEPDTGHASRLARGVYPRVCGGTAWERNGTVAVAGLSPRMRGNLYAQQSGAVLVGSIPAYAGEPSKRVRSLNLWRVYPRVCGGTKLNGL